MKYQSRHDLIDPEEPAPALEFGDEIDDDPDAPGDAYVIGEDGNSVEEPFSGSAADPRSHRREWAKPLALVLFALFLVLTTWNVTHLVQGPPPRPRLTPFQSKQALYLGVMKIDAFRRVNGAVPESLTQVGLPEGGVYVYKRLGPAHYLLAFAGNGPKVEYDSSEPMQHFFGSPREMLQMGDSQ